ncbi:hypothetical protein L1887_23610 [Cichorium endivia]|nr:hypothetical protein L1887_23610 [Cichorium endivia]
MTLYTCSVSASATADVESTQHGSTCDAATSQPTVHESTVYLSLDLHSQGGWAEFSFSPQSNTKYAVAGYA